METECDLTNPYIAHLTEYKRKSESEDTVFALVTYHHYKSLHIQLDSESFRVEATL